MESGRKGVSSVMVEVGESRDRISQLPEPILQHILFFLSAGDAACACILSKTWRRVCALLPVLNFDFDDNSSRLFGVFPVRQENKEEFMNSVDDSLVRLNKEKVIIENFRLHLTLSDLDSAFRIDHWIGLATRNYIRELDLDLDIQIGEDCGWDYDLDLDNRIGEDRGWYDLPQSTFAAKSLVVLKLRGCKLEGGVICDAIKFTCLNKLSLENVYMDEQILSKFFFSSPLLEYFSIKSCWGVKNLRISNRSMLKEVVVFQNEGSNNFDTVDIQALYLQTLHYRGRNNLLEIDVAPLKLLKELTITWAQLTNQMFLDLISKLPLLESLALLFCFELEKIKVSSHLLKSFRFRSLKCLVEAEIDTPNLVLFEYSGDRLPTVFSINISNLQETYLRVLPHYDIDTFWFLRLREYLGNFKQHDMLVLNVNTNMESTFIPEDLSEYIVPPRSVVKHLNVNDIKSPINHEALLDGLLWSCHPDILSVNSGSGFNNEFIKLLCEKFMGRPEVPLCCSSCCVRCWCHDIKDVEIEGLTGMEDRDAALIGSLPTVETGHEVRFKLKWYV
ncbi:hypothetical protein LguiA_028741 [Lonicera macranthoides]